MTNKYEILPGLWLGSERSDLIIERKSIIAKMEFSDKDKLRIREITDRLIEISLNKYK